MNYATLTAAQLTASMIDGFEEESARFGDARAVATCRAARSGNKIARATVARWIRDAYASI